MKKLATLFSDSYQEFKHVRTITTAALFGAVSIVLSYFTIVLGSYIKIGFSTIAGQMVYYLFGPVVGGCFGGAMDIIKYLIKPTAAFFPGYTLNAILAGILYGMFFYKKPLNLVRVFIAELTVAIICNMLLGTLWLDMMYGKGFLVLLPARVIKNLIQWPVNSLLFFFVAQALEASGIFRMLRALKPGNKAMVKE